MRNIVNTPAQNGVFDCDDEVAEALSANGPVVAVESAAIDANSPYPENLAHLSEICAVIREGGATPAVLALMDGKLKIGLSEDALHRLAADGDRRKISRRDIAIALAHRSCGATTVASSLWIASAVGIPVFLTGGIGGVHRGVSDTMDISADLIELSRNRCLAVCAGAKPILDVPKTLEMLETLGVPVLGWQCDGFPLYMATGDGQIDLRLETASDVAAVFQASEAAGLDGGMLLAVPPSQEVALDARDLDAAVVGALAEAEAAGVTGAKVTGFVLRALSRATDGRSEKIKRAVMARNAAVAAEVARAVTASDIRNAPEIQ